MRNKIIFTILILLTVMAMSGCVPNDGTSNQSDPAGFWWGLWHGMIAPISFIASWFNREIGIYEVINNGGWYNFGFLLGVGGFSTSASSASSRRREI